MNFFQLFMFDFDGLLVDTEKGHYEAYRRMCRGRGVELEWDFPTYCKIAHYTHNGIERQIYSDYPLLQAMEPDWNVLYKEKTQAIIELFHEGAIALMPGVERFLTELDDKGIRRCVVTHSDLTLVDVLRKQHPVLNTIPFWVTRRDYAKAKPDPECYRIALEKYLPLGGKAIGFEDTVRGLNALMGTDTKPVLVTSIDYPEIPSLVQKGVVHLKSLEEKETLFIPNFELT